MIIPDYSLKAISREIREIGEKQHQKWHFSRFWRISRETDAGLHALRLHRGHFGVALRAAGEKDKAFAELEEAYRARNYRLYVLKVDPRFDPLRDDRRYGYFIRKIGLED